MRKLALILTMLLMIATVAYAGGSTSVGGSKTGTCEWYSWGCNAFSTCYYSNPENQYIRYAYGTPERDIAKAKYDACARDFVTACMSVHGCDAKKYFPDLFPN